MTEAMKVPGEPSLGTIVRLEPDDGRRWKRTSQHLRNNWELWNRRTDGGDDGDTHLSWPDIMAVAAGTPNAPMFSIPPRAIQVVADDLMPAGTVWRTGRHLGRTVYHQLGAQPCDDDRFLGLFDDADTAQLVCELVNRFSRKESQ